jgi:hypothetical protein
MITPALLPSYQNDTTIYSATRAQLLRGVKHKNGNGIISTPDPIFALIEKGKVAYEKFMADRSDGNCDVFQYACVAQ